MSNAWREEAKIQEKSKRLQEQIEKDAEKEIIKSQLAKNILKGKTTLFEDLKVLEALNLIDQYSILVGVPQSTSSRDGGKINNAELAFIHTNGSPINNVPARPFIEPAIEANKDRINKMFLSAYNEFAQGNTTEGETKLKQIGLYAEGRVRNWFVNPDNNWAPNSERTIDAWRKKHKKGIDAVKRPLIDTGELRKSITYVFKSPSGLKSGKIKREYVQNGKRKYEITKE